VQKNLYDLLGVSSYDDTLIRYGNLEFIFGLLRFKLIILLFEYFIYSAVSYRISAQAYLYWRIVLLPVNTILEKVRAVNFEAYR